jgi:uncharacterized OB-fold protein
MTKVSYPAPREDADNAAFLDAWRQGRLVVQSCAVCSRSIFYPRPMCPHCWSDRIESHEASGRGRIVSYSLVHRPNDPSFNDEVPIVLAEIELDEGASLIARIVDCRPEDVRSGRAVELPPRSACTRYPLPVFQLTRGE